MNTRIFVGSVALALIVGTTTTTARAQQLQSTSEPSLERRGYLQERVDAPTKALELTVGTGYTQGFGMVQGGVGLPDVAQAGVGLDGGVAYRLMPRLSLGIDGQFQELYAQRGTGTRGLTAGLSATYHIDPHTRLDPFVQLGGGYRLLWETSASSPTLLTHGFEIAKLRIGADVKTSSDVAVGPVVGADLCAFVWQVPSGGSAVAIHDVRVSTFIFAGVQGRFDVTGEHEHADRIASAAPMP